ncbi:MAG: hypothetical protein NWT04_17060 [Verrucomicrobiales bacterium]|nr:hypothetical protein [Verrucomicrobiales bacterium]
MIHEDFRPTTEAELKDCLECDWWTLCNLHAIKPKGGGVEKYRPNKVQKSIYRLFWWLNYILKSRQHGVSTFWVLFFLNRIIRESGKVAGVIDITEKDAKKKLGMAKVSYDHMDDPKIHPETWKIGAMVKQRAKLIKGNDAPFPEELVFSNGSSFYAGVSFRGGTLQYGLFTEFGKIAIKDPPKAAEIVEGAENAMHEGSIAVFEFTMEGGQSGLAYEKTDAAMKNSRNVADLTRLDPLFMFFGWFEDPANQLSAEETAMTMRELERNDVVHTRNGPFNWREYFHGKGNAPGVLERLESAGVELTYSQIGWYVKKRMSQGFAMLKEHPTFAEEAFQAPVTGAIYADHVLRAEAEERVSNFNRHAGKLVHTTWDIGSNKNLVVCYWQRVGPEWWCIDCDHDLDLTIGERVGMMNRKGYNFGAHCLPHDAAHQKIGSITTVQVLKEAGLENVKVIPQTTSTSLRLDGMWGLFPNIRFIAKPCEKLLKMLKGYRWKEERAGTWITDVIVKDETNHYADAFGYLWEADQASLLQDSNPATRGKSVQRASVQVGRL